MSVPFPVKRVILAPSGAGKSTLCRRNPMFVDGDPVVQHAIDGWTGGWTELEDFSSQVTQYRMHRLLIESLCIARDRVILFCGGWDPAYSGLLGFWIPRIGTVRRRAAARALMKPGRYPASDAICDQGWFRMAAYAQRSRLPICTDDCLTPEAIETMRRSRYAEQDQDQG